jgi:hypothetical protein
MLGEMPEFVALSPRKLEARLLELQALGLSSGEALHALHDAPLLFWWDTPCVPL